MSSIFSHLLRVSSSSSFTTQRTSFNQPPSSSSSSSGKHDHYQHGIPGIPNDGKVVLLKNSHNGSQVYLVGTVHSNKQTTQTVKKVINYDTIAIELCEKRARQCLEWRSVDDNLYTLYLESKRAQGGLSTKVAMFIRNCLRLWRGEIVPINHEFRVAIEEASGVGAGCYFIDQNIDVTRQQLCNLLISSYSIRQSNERVLEAHKQIHEDDFTRSFNQELNSFWKDFCPEIFKVLIEDRDKHMFSELRRFQGKLLQLLGWLTWMGSNYCGNVQRMVMICNLLQIQKCGLFM